MSKVPQVLVVDDEPDLLLLIELTLTKLGLEVIKASSCKEALKRLGQHHEGSQHFDLCLSDMNLGDGTGLDLIADIQARKLDIPIAILTAYSKPENAVAALKAGAFDYLAKPVSLDQLRTLVKTALKVNQPNKALHPNSEEVVNFIGNSTPIQKLRDTIQKLAKNQSPVHITGESGTGKELAAKRLHALSARAAGPFVAVNCGAIPETLMESEFFGSKKGAYTGADRDREGFFQAANGGTLFLDEVADLPLSMQVKLLRAIQERKVRKVGDTLEESVDVRLLSATHKPLSQLVEDNLFRQDLYYRLNVISLHTPALREIPEDIPQIADHLLKKIAQPKSTTRVLNQEALALIKRYRFPGNVREFENILERACALADHTVQLTPEDLHLEDELNAREHTPDTALSENLDDTLDRIERHYVLEALAKASGNRTQAARALGISFRSLQLRLERLQIDI